MPNHTAPDALTEQGPLVITADNDLLQDLLRIAAVAGVEPRVVADPADARRSWHAAPLVVVGADAVSALRAETLPAGVGIVIVAQDDHDVAVLRAGLALGAAAVLTLPADETELAQRLADMAEGRAAPAPLVAVVGGCGGAGASTFSAALAVSARAQRLRVTLVDADPLGGGLDLLLGGEDVDGLRWSAIEGARGRISGTALAAALPHIASIPVLSCDSSRPIPGEAMASVLEAVRRVSDIVIADLPRRVDPASAEVLSRTAAGFVVIPADIRATAATLRVVAEIGAAASNFQAVIRGPVRGMLTAEVVARHVRLPLAGEYPRERAVELAAAHGEPPARTRRGRLRSLCHRLVTEVVESSGVSPA